MSLPVSTRVLRRFTPPALDIPLAERRLAEARQAYADFAKDAGDAPADDHADTLKALAAAIDAAALRADKVRAAVEALGAPPVYLLKVPDPLERVTFRREMAAAGARYPGDREMLDLLRAIVEASEADSVEAMVELIDRALAASSPDGAVDLSEADRAQLGRLEDAARKVPEYAALVAARRHWLDAAPIILAQMFLRGWENVPHAFERKNGVVPMALIEQIGEDDISAIGGELLGLLSVSATQRKNSASPSRSTGTRAGSPAAPTTAGGAGSSMASNTAAIPSSSSTAEATA